MGWHLGLERMTELCERLANPQRRFRVIHVVGTNGKSSVAELSRLLLGAAGVRAGAYISPHLGSWAERVRLPSDDEARRYAGAVEAAVSAAEAVTADSDGESKPTQFEIATAAAFLALADDDVEVAAVEAGMGGRLDATNVCDAEVVALTNVTLDHTQWLGETIAEIAAEKLAVVGPGATLVLGNVPAEVAAQAEEAVTEADGTLAHALNPSERAGARAIPTHPARSAFGAENLAVARCAVGAVLGRDALSARFGYGAVLPARAELIDGDPPVLLDLAHNPAAAEALARLPELRGRRVVACVALLDDKDLSGFAAALSPVLDEAIATETGPLPGSARPGARPHSASSVRSAFEAAGLARTYAIADPRTAVETALARARDLGGLALITGSHYLLRHSWIPGRDRSFST